MLLKESEQYNMNEMLTCFVKKYEIALTDALLRQEVVLSEFKQEVDKITLKWHKRIYELCFAVSLNIGKLEQVSFTE